ncbi:hypothetical protein LTS10_013240 [Elasticomyces elasticus]|nr:hypothetical protein LTS10_013240 [Elasticomyces elasticus]
MDEAKILLPGGLAAIGTRDLNACSGIAILGRAMIMAHIAPLPPHDLGASQQREIEPGEGEAHFESLLLEVQTLYNTHISHFPNRTTTWAIFGTFEGEIAMPEKLEIARQRFHAMGLPMRSALYTIGKASERTNPAAGTVLGVLQHGITYLYVENQLEDSINFNDQPTSTTKRYIGSKSLINRYQYASSSAADIASAGADPPIVLREERHPVCEFEL